MERKIIAIMVALVVVAAVVVVSVTLAASGVGGRAGGFTSLFNKLEQSGNSTHPLNLKVPDSWKQGDKKTVGDKIVDMSFERTTVGQTHVYTTHIWFAYMGDKWNNPLEGTAFNVPDDSFDGWMHVGHGLFEITVTSATNLSAQYDIGDVISLTSTLVMNNNAAIAFGDWAVSDTL